MQNTANITIVRTIVIAIAFWLTGACEKAPPPQLATSEANQDDLKAIGEFIKKDAPKPEPSTGLPVGHPPIGTGQATWPVTDEPAVITFEPPPDWKSEPVSSALRKAQYRIPGTQGPASDGQMVVFYFGMGQGGSVDSNIDRWKGMFSSADGKPVLDAAIHRESREVNGMKATLLDVTGHYVDPMAGGAGPSPAGESRMLSAIIETSQGLWFFKSVGPVTTMSAHTENFKRFLDSIRKR